MVNTIGVLCAECDKSTVSELIEEFEKEYNLSFCKSNVTSSEILNSEDFIALIVVLSENLQIDYVNLNFLDLEQQNTLPIFPIRIDNYDEALPLPLLSYLPLSKGNNFIRNRIKLLITYGLHDVMQWNRIHVLASTWQKQGRNESDLLSYKDLELTKALLEKPIREINIEESKIIVTYFTASVERRRQLNMILAKRILSICSLLILLSIFAWVQKVVADKETMTATTEIKESLSKRYATSALELLFSDPDLPWILSQKALEESVSEESLAAGRTVANNLIPHKSYSLPAPAASLCSLTENSYAIGLQDGHGFIVFDVSEQKEIFSKTAQNGNTFVSGSPNGIRFATLNYESRITEIYSYERGEVKQLFTLSTPIDKIELWLDDDHFICLTDGNVMLADITTNSLTPFFLCTSSGENLTGVVSLAADKEHTWLAAATNTELVFYRIVKNGNFNISNEIIAEKVFKQIRYIYSNDIKNTLFVESGNELSMVDIRTLASGLSEISVAVAEYSGSTRISKSLAVDIHGNFYIGDSTGMINVLSFGFSKTKPDFPYPYDNFPYTPSNIPAFSAAKAHNGEVTAIVTNTNGSWASVGEDCMLRIWETPVFGNTINDVLVYNGIMVSNIYPGLEESKRCTLGSEYGSNTATAVMASGQCFAQIDRKTLATNNYMWLWGNISRAKVMSGGNTIAALRSLDGEKDRISITDMDVSTINKVSEKTTTFEDVSSDFIDLSLFELSPDGSHLAAVIAMMNNRGNLTLWSADGSERTLRNFVPDANAIYVTALEGDDALTISSLGTVTELDGSQYNLFDLPNTITSAVALSKNKIITIDEKGIINFHEKGIENHIITTIPKAIGSFAIKVSNSGKYAAFIGKKNTVILDIESANVVTILEPLSQLNLSSDDKLSYPVQDILFDDDERGAMIIHSNGWITRIDIYSKSDIAFEICQHAPREISSDEESVFER